MNWKIINKNHLILTFPFKVLSIQQFTILRHSTNIFELNLSWIDTSIQSQFDVDANKRKRVSLKF